MTHAATDLRYDDLLIDGFDGEGFSPAGGLYYKQTLEQSAGSVEFQRDVSLDGRGALKLSVKPLGSGGKRTDISERAEIWERPQLRVPYDRGIWYGFA
ncbi:MAG: polysaccharide lyase, partial [Aestuariivirga sp.]